MAGGEPFKPLSEPAGKPAVPAKGHLSHLADARAVLLRMVEVIEQDGRFPVDAYRFLQEGLEYTVRRAHPEAVGDGEPPRGSADPRHVDGAQLSLGLRDLALARWGRLAKAVLNNWGITCTAHFGEMVFVLVKHEFLQKTDRDRLEDFQDVFAFADFEVLFALPDVSLDVSDVNYESGSGAAMQAGGLS